MSPSAETKPFWLGIEDAAGGVLAFMAFFLALVAITSNEAFFSGG